MRIFGIDPGTGRLGYAVIDKIGNKETLVDCGCLETIANTSLADRLLYVFEELERLVKLHKPDSGAIEDLFFSKNVKTAFSVAEARGVCLLVFSKKKIPVTSYTPNQIKLTITGSGSADKKQVIFMVKKLIKVPDDIKLDDTFDAIATALTHSAMSNARMKL